MTQYHYERSSTAVEPTVPPKPSNVPDRDLQRLQDVIDQQRDIIEHLQKEIRRIYRQLDAHARVINTMSRRNG